MTTAVPAIIFSDSGIALPQESAILAGRLSDYNAAFGGGMNTSLSTPQGQMAQSDTAIIGDKNNQIAAMVNNLDPDFADGIWQDALGKIYFLTRSPAIATVVQCTCIGLAGTVIPVNARVQDVNGNIYLCIAAGTIPSGGSITLPFANQNTGPISCAAGAVTTIYQAITGWDTVSNPAGGVLGQVEESRADFEYRRQQSIALNGHGSLPSIYAAVFDVEGVLDVYATENVSDLPMMVGATHYSLKPHSLYVAVVGGSSTDIAQAIWLKKNEGSNMNGNTHVTIADTHYSVPQPTYDIVYEVPTSTPVKFAVQIANVSGLPSDIVAQVKAAIIAAFAGQGGAPRARIGSTIYASNYYSGISKISPTVSIISVLLGLAASTDNIVTMGVDQSPTVSAADISVTLV